MDALLFIDNELGISIFDNEDALEVNTYLFDKRAFLEQNIFKLVEKSKELTDFELKVVIEKYYEFLMLFIHITEWLSVNLKKYNGEDIHISINGAFIIQQNYYITHLKDICNYFGKVLDLDWSMIFQ